MQLRPSVATVKPGLWVTLLLTSVTAPCVATARGCVGQYSGQPSTSAARMPCTECCQTRCQNAATVLRPPACSRPDSGACATMYASVSPCRPRTHDAL